MIYKTVYYKNNKLDKRRTYPAILKYYAIDLLHGRRPVKVRISWSEDLV